jgi:hypothetical protein
MSPSEVFIHSALSLIISVLNFCVTCVPTGLLFCQVEEHCALNSAYHLSLAMRHIEILRAEKGYLQATVASLQTQVAQLRATVAARGGSY